MTDQEAIDLLERLADGEGSLDVILDAGDPLISAGEQLEKLDDLIEHAESALQIVKANRAKTSDRVVDTMRNRGLIKNNGTGNYTLPSGNKVSLRNSTKPGIKKDLQPRAYMWFLSVVNSEFTPEENATLQRVMYQNSAGEFKVGEQELLSAVKLLRKKGKALPPFIGTFEIVKATILNPRKAKETASDE